jgi:hypothetical protein
MSIQRIKYATRIGPSHAHITHIGNDEQTWPIDEAIRLLRTRRVQFYTYARGHVGWVDVHTDGHRTWVQTTGDTVRENNLLNLPPCKVRAA